jgi:hypothetical protein
VTGINLSANTPQQRFDGRWWPATTTSLAGMAFFISAAAAFVPLLMFRTRGIGLALEITARWSFLFFWLAYTASAMARLFGARFAELARRSRDLGLAYASAQLVHLGLVVLIIFLSKSIGGMVFFWVGIFCTYLLALLSLPQLHNALGLRAWGTLRTVAMEYIALTFAADFILGPLQSHGISKYPLSYLPFAILLVGGAALRVTANVRRHN